MDCTENTIPLLLFMGHCLVMASCCNSTIIVLCKYATIYNKDTDPSFEVFFFCAGDLPL
jgi:hypothetical protein